MRAEVLSGPERRRRWTAEQKLRIVREAFEGGARVTDVARRHEVSRAQLYQWRTAFGEGQFAADGSLVSFVPVMEVAAPSPAERRAMTTSAPAQVIEIGLAGGRNLKVPSSLATAELRRLIRAVESA